MKTLHVHLQDVQPALHSVDGVNKAVFVHVDIVHVNAVGPFCDRRDIIGNFLWPERVADVVDADACIELRPNAFGVRAQ